MADNIFVGSFLAFIKTVIIISLVYGILTAIGMWKTVKKTGEEGWKGIVPIYNYYVLCTKIGVYKYWPLIVLASPILNIVPIIGQVAVPAIYIYFAVIFNVSLAKSFGKDETFAIGLILLPPVFYLILGGKDSNYVGPNPMDDPVMKFVDENILNKNSNSSSTTPQSGQQASQEHLESLYEKKENFCPNCGAVVGENTAFCSSCGNKLK